MAEISIKRAQKKDIINFKNKEWRKFNKTLGRIIIPHRICFVALAKNKVVGSIEVSIWGGVVCIDNLIVAGKFRGKGIATLLLKKIEDLALKKKCHKLTLRTSEDHKEAISLYKKLGFKIDAIIKEDKFHRDWYYLAKKIKGE